MSYRECGIEIPKNNDQSFNNQSITSLAQSLRSPKKKEVKDTYCIGAPSHLKQKKQYLFLEIAAVQSAA